MLGSTPAVQRAAHPAAIQRDWATFSSVLMQRQTALRDLYPAATSVPRALGSLLALALAVGGSLMLRPGIAGEPWGSLQAPILLVVGIVLVVVAAVLAVLLMRAGNPAVAGTLAWAVLPTVITEDGRRQRHAGELSARQHQAVDEAARLLSPAPLRLRQVGAGLAILATVATTALAIGPVIEQTRPYANDGTLGAMVAALVRMFACWWIAVASGLGAWRLTVARNGGLGPGGQGARVWTLRRTGVDVTDADPRSRDGEARGVWSGDEHASLPPTSGVEGHGERRHDGSAYTSASPGEPGRTDGYRGPGAPDGYGPPPGYGRTDWYGGPGAPDGYGPPPGYGSAPGYGNASSYGPPPGYGSAPGQHGGDGPSQGHGQPHGYGPSDGQPPGGGAPHSYGPPQSYGRPQGYGPPQDAGPQGDGPPWGAGPQWQGGDGPVQGAPEARLQRPDLAAATPPGAVSPDLPVEQGSGSGSAFGSHSAPAWRETGEWEEVPDVRVGGYLLDGGITLVGRDPEPRGGELVDNLMVVPDPSMSKTHLSVRLAADSLLVIDRDSTNGTYLVAQDGSVSRLEPWNEVAVPEGAALRVGESLLEWDDPWSEDEDDAGQTILR